MLGEGHSDSLLSGGQLR